MKVAAIIYLVIAALALVLYGLDGDIRFLVITWGSLAVSSIYNVGDWIVRRLQ